MMCKKLEATCLIGVWVFYCSRSHYHQLSLKTSHIYCPTFSVCQESKHWLTASTAQGFPGLKSRARLGLPYQARFSGVDRIQLLAVLGCKFPPSCLLSNRDCFQLLEVSCCSQAPCITWQFVLSKPGEESFSPFNLFDIETRLIGGAHPDSNPPFGSVFTSAQSLCPNYNNLIMEWYPIIVPSPVCTQGEGTIQGLYTRG